MEEDFIFLQKTKKNDLIQTVGNRKLGTSDDLLKLLILF